MLTVPRVPGLDSLAETIVIIDWQWVAFKRFSCLNWKTHLTEKPDYVCVMKNMSIQVTSLWALSCKMLIPVIYQRFWNWD